MAEFYLDVSAVGNEYQAYADTPATWGVPQDGNGKAGPGHAAAVAIGKIDCNGASATGTGTVGVLGVTVSSTLNASGSALATAIVTAINASATAVSATYSAALLPLNKLVFARVNPSVNTEVQIMLRIAGADWNGISPTRANITGGGVTAFSGGAAGPFAYLCSTSTLFGKTARGYGLLTALKVAAVTDPGSAADVIHMRTRRSGSDLQTLMTDTTTRYDWTWSPAASLRQFLADDGTVWSGDGGQFTLNLYVASAISGGDNTFQLNASTSVSFASRSGERFRIYADVRAGSYGYKFRFTNNSISFVFEGVVIEESAASTAGLYLNQFESVNGRFYMRGGRWIAKAARTLGSAGTNPGSRAIYDRVEFEYFSLTNNVSGFINLNLGGAHDQQFRFSACSFKDRNGVYSVTSPVLGGTYPQANVLVDFDGCTGVDAVSSGWGGTVNDFGRQLVWENFGPSRDWRVESGAWQAEWRADSGHPTLSSVLPSGGPWSAKVMVRNVSIWGLTHKVLKLPGFYRDASAVRTIALEFLAQMAFSRSQLALMVAYMDPDGVVRYQHTLLGAAEHMVAPTAIPTSSAAWELNGQIGFTAYKLSLTTDYAIKQGTEFVAWLLFTGVIASDQTVYVNGEVSLT